MGATEPALNRKKGLSQSWGQKKTSPMMLGAVGSADHMPGGGSSSDNAKQIPPSLWQVVGRRPGDKTEAPGIWVQKS